MEKKQTAVEWLIEKRNRLEYEYSTKSIGISEYIERKKDIEVQAKQTEKEQIVNAVDGFPLYTRDLLGDDYYNELYGGQDEN